MSTIGTPTCDCKCLVTKKKCKCIDKVTNIGDSILQTSGGPNTLTTAERLRQRALRMTSEEVLLGPGGDSAHSSNNNTVLELNTFKRKIEDSMVDPHPSLKGTAISQDRPFTRSELEKKRVSFDVQVFKK
jgi:hypothetical protein